MTEKIIVCTIGLVICAVCLVVIYYQVNDIVRSFQ